MDMLKNEDDIAVGLIWDGKIEEFNKFRIALITDWIPNLSGKSFVGKDLRGINLSDANLKGTHFFGCDVRGADFTRANLDNTDLRGIIFDDSTRGLPLVRQF